ncbi:MAG: hypothetical protein SF097_20300 [Acidobacteriota bacterium]|nr:hypothetical protein [Acidobacteriota bacterium]
MSKTAEVYTNDPQKEQFTLTVSMVVLSDMTPQGKIVGPFVVGPNNQWSARSPRGMSTNGLISISNNTAEAIKITQMNPGGEAFNVKLQTLEEGKRYALEFLSSPTLPAGSHVQTVKLATDSKQMPELTVDLQIVVVPAVSVNPANLVFENVPVSDPEGDVTYLSKFVWVKLARGNGLEVKSITSDLPFLKIKNESSNDSNPTTQTIVLRVGFNEKPPVGTHSGKIKIETNNADVKVIEVPIKIVAK